MALVPGRAHADAPTQTGAASLEDLEQYANALNRDERDGEAARAWAELARHDEIVAKQHAIAALRTVSSALRAQERSRDTEALCLAHAVVREYLARDDANAEDAKFLRARLTAVEQEFITTEGNTWRAVCEPPPPPSCDDQRPLLARRLSNVSESTCEPPVLDPRARRLTIAGVTNTAIGSAALISMTATLVGAYQRIDEVRALTLESIENDGATPAAKIRVEELRDEIEMRESAAIALGVLGGATVIAGVTMLAVGQHRVRKAFALSPVWSPRFTGVSWSGRF